MYNKNKTSYNMNIRHIIKISTFVAFQKTWLSDMKKLALQVSRSVYSVASRVF